MGKVLPKNPGKEETPVDGERDLLAAYHEAGHAVMAWQRKVPLHRVTIRPGDGNSGMTYIAPRLPRDMDGPITPELQRRIEDYVVVALAGALAEEEYTGRPHQINNDVDIQNASLVASAMIPNVEELEAFFVWLQIGTRNWLRFRRAVLDAVAHQLIQRKTLSARKLRDLIWDTTHQSRLPTNLPME